MRKIFKYPVPIDDVFSLNLPEGAKILSFQAQGERPTIWVLVNPDAPPTRRQFRLAGTGHPISDYEDELQFVGTCQMKGGSLVWHLFELI
jgi:hypothetical protein